MDTSDTRLDDDRNGTINDPSSRANAGLSWSADEPVPDGGEGPTAGIAPEDATALSSFLENHESAPAYELTYREAGEERTRTLHRASLVDESVDWAAVDPVLRCTPVAPEREGFTVQVPSIERIEVVDPSADAYTAGARTAAEEATGLRRLAQTDPSAVDMSALLALPTPDDASAEFNREALRALRLVATERPEESTPAVPLLGEFLTRGSPAVTADALTTLRLIGEADTGAITPLTDAIVPYLPADDGDTRREATACVSRIAMECPEDLIDTVPTLAMLVEDHPDCRADALFALARLTRQEPESAKPFVGTLRDIVLDESLPDGVRLNATVAFGNCVGEHPDAGLGAVDDVAGLLGAENRQLRNNAVALLADVAAVHTDVVEDHVDDIGDLLTVDDDYTRINASCVVARVADDFPASVDHLISTLVDLLMDEEPVVRKNACWALGYLEAKEGRRALETRAADDADPEVRRTAAWALDRLEGEW